MQNHYQMNGRAVAHGRKLPELPSVLPSWWPNWADQTVVIVGSGPSATDEPLDRYRDDAKFILVNNSYKLAPWGDVVYGCDVRWWDYHGGCSNFTGLKLSQDDDVKMRPSWGVHRVCADHSSDRIEMQRPGYIGWGGNSGFQALNLAAQFCFSKICLVGFNMTYDHGEHWHNPHPWELPAKVANVARHRRAVDNAALTLEKLGIDVVNCTRNSALKNYRLSTLEREFR